MKTSKFILFAVLLALCIIGCKHYNNPDFPKEPEDIIKFYEEQAFPFFECYTEEDTIFFVNEEGRILSFFTVPSIVFVQYGVEENPFDPDEEGTKYAERIGIGHGGVNYQQFPSVFRMTFMWIDGEGETILCGFGDENEQTCHCSEKTPDFSKDEIIVTNDCGHYVRLKRHIGLVEISDDEFVWRPCDRYGNLLYKD